MSQSPRQLRSNSRGDQASPENRFSSGLSLESWKQLLNEIAIQWPVRNWQDLGVVVGCSGGADSVGLVSSLATLRSRSTPSQSTQIELHGDPARSARGFLVVGHFNHRLRGEQSDADQSLVEDLCQRLKLSCRVAGCDSVHRDEATMRDQRMRFLIDTAKATGARYVALAHSADDNVETILHHLMRGTGPAGLSGMSHARPLDQDLVLVRPLLRTKRELIRSALTTRGISWREDASNLDPAYRRNWIRHEVLPLIESRYPRAVEAIGRAIDGQQQWRRVIDRLAANWLEQNQLADQPVTLRRDESLEAAVAVAAAQRLWHQQGWPRRSMNQSHWTRLAETLGSQPVDRTTGNHQSQERFSLPFGVDVIVQHDRVTLKREKPSQSGSDGEN